MTRDITLDEKITIKGKLAPMYRGQHMIYMRTLGDLFLHWGNCFGLSLPIAYYYLPRGSNWRRRVHERQP